jgi:putative transposase
MIQGRKQIRLMGYDYSSDNLYFVTSCVHNRICCFGEIALTGRDPSLQNAGNEPVGTGRDPSPQTMIDYHFL